MCDAFIPMLRPVDLRRVAERREVHNGVLGEPLPLGEPPDGRDRVGETAVPRFVDDDLRPARADAQLLCVGHVKLVVALEEVHDHIGDGHGIIVHSLGLVGPPLHLFREAVELGQGDAALLEALYPPWRGAGGARGRLGPGSLEHGASHGLAQGREHRRVLAEEGRLMGKLVLAILSLGSAGYSTVILQLLPPTVEHAEVAGRVRQEAVSFVSLAATEEVEDLPSVRVLRSFRPRDIPILDGLHEGAGGHRDADLPDGGVDLELFAHPHRRMQLEAAPDALQRHGTPVDE
mmetsp:Transcript_108565/g.312749  ORF Transcript_108565/g.312749 Transcript_108565/m.312749 type:complete len:290 (-) Transcript_108565:599-1468(-)